MGGGAHGRGGAIAVVAVLLLSGCRGGAAEDEPVVADATPSPTPRVTPSPTPSPEPPAVDPFSVPDDPADIDEAYVQAVLDELDALDGEMFRIVVREREITEEAEALLVAIYEEPARSEQLEAMEIEFEEDFVSIQPEPGDRRLDVTQIHSAGPDCVFVETVPDMSQVVRQWEGWDRATALYIGLRTKLGISPDEELNPTGWQVFYIRVHRVDEEVGNPCIS